MKKTLTANNQRNRRAFSLVTVTIVGLLATMWLASTTSALLSVQRNLGGNQYATTLQSAAESAVDYVAGQLNGTQRATYDESTYKVTKTISISPATLGAPSGTAITVTVRNIDPTPSSYLFDPQIGLNQGWSIIPSTNSNLNPWRLVQATASYGDVSKAVTAYLRPLYPAHSMNNLSTSPSQRPFFSNGAFATDGLMLGQNTTTDGTKLNAGTGLYEAVLSTGGQPLGGDIGSFNIASLNGVAVGGSVDVPASASSILTGTGSTVNQYVTTNGTAPTFVDTGTSQNVFGYVQNSETPRTPFVMENAAETPNTMPPAQSAPMAADGSLVTSASSTGSIGSGSFTGGMGSSADFSGSSMSLSSPVNTSGTTVRVFIDGNSSASSVVQINANVNAAANTNTNLFQVWYNGTGTIEVRSPVMRGTIYAPNATVLMGAKSATDTGSYDFTGAVVAKTIAGYKDSSGVLQSTRNLQLHFDNSLGGTYNASGSAASRSMFYDPADYATPKFMQVVAYGESIKNH